MADWLSISPLLGIGNGTFNVTAEKNTSTEARTATVTVTTLGGLSRTVTVTQQGSIKSTYLTLSQTTYICEQSTSTYSLSEFTVESSSAWKANGVCEGIIPFDEISVLLGTGFKNYITSGDAGTTVINIVTIYPYAVGTKTVTFTNEDGDTATFTVLVTVQPISCFPTSGKVAATESSYTSTVVTVADGTTFSASSKSDDFRLSTTEGTDYTSASASLSKIASGTTVYIIANKNTGTSTRSGTITFTKTSNSSATCSFTVTQSGSSSNTIKDLDIDAHLKYVVVTVGCSSSTITVSVSTSVYYRSNSNGTPETVTFEGTISPTSGLHDGDTFTIKAGPTSIENGYYWIPVEWSDGTIQYVYMEINNGIIADCRIALSF